MCEGKVKEKQTMHKEVKARTEKSNGKKYTLITVAKVVLLVARLAALCFCNIF